MRLLRTVSTVILSALAVSAVADDYPNKAIRLIMPYPIGGSIDIAGRMVAQRLADNLGQAVVVDNRTGAGGIVGTETGARAAPDGYTVLMGGTGTLALSPSLQKNLPYDPNKDFTPVTLLVTIPYVVVVQPSFKAANIKELIALAKAKPNEINYGSGGSGSAPHLAAELFKTMADVRITHVPYKGSTPAITDTMSGQVQLTFTGIPSVMTQMKAGRLRPIGVTSLKRTAALPEVPTIAESGVPGYEVNPWFGVLLPARTPQPLVSRLNAEILKVLQLPATRERFAAEGFEAAGNTPAQFAAYIKAEQIKWGKVIKDAGIKAD
ncbi:MAG: tripartite tricarboxylate transporter substrate binding protein [Betaproteobacteria bacterium]|jgi:tripartite-type tricarboxylate transporter receptor subunit TctC